VNDQASPRYAFGPYVLDTARGLLSKDGVRVPLTPRVLGVLIRLVEHAGELLPKERLMSEVWGDTAVEENNLTRQISTLRKLLHERPGQAEFIVTVPGVGYRFVAPVHLVTGDLPPLDPTPPTGIPIPPGVSSPPHRPLWHAAVAAGAALALLGAGVLLGIQFGRPAAAITAVPRQVTYGAGLQEDPAWSPDGQRLAFASDRAGNSDIWIQRLDDGEPVQLTTSPARDWQPDWSPDGQFIVFRSERDGGGLYIVPVAGGPERRLAGFGQRPRWSPSGREILFSSGAGEAARAVRIYVARAEGGEPRLVQSDVLAGFGPASAAWHPDGRITLWGHDASRRWAMATVSSTGRDVMRSAIPADVARDLDSGDVAFSNFVWAPSGRYVYFEGLSHSVRHLWRVPVDPQTLDWTGPPVRLTSGTETDTGLSISPDGRHLAFSALAGRSGIWAFGFDPVAGRLTDDGQMLTSGDPDERGLDAWSDGSKLVYVTEHSNRQELWERSAVDLPHLLMSGTDWNYTPPKWSPDGKRLAYERKSRRTPTDRTVVVYSVDEHREQVVLPLGGRELVPSDWSADGRTLIGMCRLSANDPPGACRLSLESDKALAPERIAADPRFAMMQLRFSPNGRWISFIGISAADQSISTIFLMSLEGGSWTQITDGAWYDDKPRWSPDGRTLYFLSNRDGHTNVWGRRIDPDTGRPSGAMFRVTDFLQGRKAISPYVGQMELNVCAKRLFLPMYEATGQIWTLDLDN